ncbi:ArnT family glycosyltransferase [Candidatus Nitrosotenuis sp. DW1]|uniref:ArnT family glycosyltransferase n=1 Tax=Candidatus Nitrosotenuis sp. DW1 TaxID=2259672 RepID=UPI0015CAEFE0|nr:glycosyltransferase family 39 protein [Candidatus Nitrosotenuis sp. DW1]QLH09714.1 hypothetical protein DSQ19_09775 [Candidatus Nitrosotenuis sp. DW1]
MSESIESRTKFVTKKTVISLTVIITVGFLIRFHYFPYGIPITLDGLRYFLYAMDVSVLGHLPTGYSFPNNGWPLFVSIFFSIFHLDNFLDYITLQRVLTVIISVATAIPVYFLCKRFFENTLALVGAALFIFHPRIIQNSLLGTTDPLFIFLSTTSLLLFLNHNKIAVYFSFVIAALSALVRYEGLLLIIPFSIMFFVKYKKQPKIVLRYSAVLCLFVLTLLPMAYLRIETTGKDGLLSHIISGAKVTATQGSVIADSQSKFSLVEGLYNLVKFSGYVLVPTFVIFIPLGLLLFFKNRNYNSTTLIITGVLMLIPALYAYGRGIQEPRYLFVIFPVVAIISLYTLKKILAKSQKQNIALIVVIGAVLITSIIYLDFKKIDLEHEKEAIQLSLFIHNLNGSVNEYSPESTYVETAGMYDVKFPTLSNSIQYGSRVIPLDGSSVEDTIKIGKSKGLSYLVIDSLNTKANRKPFFNDVFYHEEKYPYLSKVFDSSQHGYDYQVKIFKIDYEKFEALSQKP